MKTLFVFLMIQNAVAQGLMMGTEQAQEERSVPSLEEERVKDLRVPTQRNVPMNNTELERLNLNSPELIQVISNAKKTAQDVLLTVEDVSSETLDSMKSKPYMPTQQEALETVVEQQDIYQDSVKVKMSSVERGIVPAKKQVTQKKEDVFYFISKGNKSSKEIEEKISLPSGSSAIGELMAGVEIDSDTERVDVRLLGAFVGPNSSFVELEGCHVWMTVKLKMNTRRVKGEADEVVCRGKSGEVFVSKVTMQLRDSKDEYIGVRGELNLENFETAAGLQFAENFVNGFGKAISAANVTQTATQATSEFGSEKTTNVTGDKSAYIAGQTIADATGGFLARISDFYWGLRPTVAVPPGTKVIMTITNSTEISKNFFKENERKNNGYNTY